MAAAAGAARHSELAISLAWPQVSDAASSCSGFREDSGTTIPICLLRVRCTVVCSSSALLYTGRNKKKKSTQNGTEVVQVLQYIVHVEQHKATLARVKCAWLLAVRAAVGAMPLPLPGPGSVSRRDTSSIVHACTRSTDDSRSWPARFCYLQLFGLLLYRKAHRQKAKQLQLPNKAHRLQRADQRFSIPFLARPLFANLLTCYSIPVLPRSSAG